MVKLDEKAVVAPLDDAALARLAAALNRPEVVAAWVFGSQAKGQAGPLWLRDGYEPDLHGGSRRIVLVDVDRVRERLRRLHGLIDALEDVHRGGEAAYLTGGLRRTTATCSPLSPSRPTR